MPKYKKEEIRAPAEGPVIMDLPVDKLDPFPDHPYKVQDDGDLEQLMLSIKNQGLMTPLLVRKMYHGRYELIAGHRRLFACQKLDMTTVRCQVVELTKEEATIAMVESNFQRDRLLPSEKAFAYKMRLEAMKMLISRIKEVQRKGGETLSDRPLDEQLEKASAGIRDAYGLSMEEIARLGTAASRRKGQGDPVGHPTKSRDLVAQETGESVTQIRRYIRLTELIPELLDLVDQGKLGMRTAVELSYLEHRQKDVLECIEINEAAPTHAQAIRMRKLYGEGKLTPKAIRDITGEDKPNQKERIVLHGDRFRKMIPKNIPKQEYEDYIAKAMEYYGKYLQKRRQQER